MGMDDRYAKVLHGDWTPDDLKRAKEQFWTKLKAVMGQIPFTRDAVALYYLMRDNGTPLSLRGTAVLALLYFISPLDFVPDTLPMIGFLDDAMVVAAAISALAPILKPFRGKAEEWFKTGAEPEPEVVKAVEVEQR